MTKQCTYILTHKQSVRRVFAECSPSVRRVFAVHMHLVHVFTVTHNTCKIQYTHRVTHILTAIYWYERVGTLHPIWCKYIHIVCVQLYTHIVHNLRRNEYTILNLHLYRPNSFQSYIYTDTHILTHTPLYTDTHEYTDTHAYTHWCHTPLGYISSSHT